MYISIQRKRFCCFEIRFSFLIGKKPSNFVVGDAGGDFRVHFEKIMFTLKKKTQQQEIHFSHFVLQSAMHATRGCLPLIQLMSAHRVEICRVLYRAYFTNTLFILPSAYIAICTPWLSHPHILHTPSTFKICIYAACVDEIRKYAHISCTSF